MKKIITLVSLVSLVTFSSFSAHAESCNNYKTISNLKNNAGKNVAGIDHKFFIQNCKTYHEASTLKPSVPADWQWENNIDPNKPIFNQLDENRNGAISKREFRKQVRNDQEDKVFLSIDTDKSNKISRSELEASPLNNGKS